MNLQSVLSDVFLQTNALVPDPVSTRVLLRISYEPEVGIWLFLKVTMMASLLPVQIRS